MRTQTAKSAGSNRDNRSLVLTPCLLLLVLILAGSTLTTAGTAQKPVAELPRVYIDTTWNPPLGGTTWAMHTAAQLSSALNSAAPGDIIVLDAGTTYSGNFVLPAKLNPNNKWIYVSSSALANLPQGKRVSLRNAGRETGHSWQCQQPGGGG